ncbi:HipA N-terminal domain-containing protein [bacterium]|nr:HipA N-terminal domain-containing protein [bacterium]
MKGSKFRRAEIRYQNERAGVLEEIEGGYRFSYDKHFLEKKISISVSMPFNQSIHENEELFPFFIGLLPEGWYLDTVCSTLKIDKTNRFGLLLATCQDTIGAVSVWEMK